ncbi:MAG: efflux RND transporter periplasmic adaptor subunit [Candidatus Krumholzibacteriota bacterium]
MLLSLVFLTGSGGCGDSGGDQAAPGGQGHGPGAGNHGQGHKPGGRPAQPAIPVAVTRVVSGSISSYYRATATLEAEKEAQILARATGVVETLLVEEGDFVDAGDPLLKVDNDEYRYRLEQAAAATANTRSRFERMELMMKEELATEEEFQAVRSELASAEADEGLARLALSHTTVTAPFSGRVTSRLVDVGQNLTVGDAVMVMADFDPLLARVHVPSREFRKLQADQAVNLVLDSTGARLAGRIKLVSPVIDPTSGTIKLTIEVPEYPEQTRPGDFAQVQIVTEKRDGVALVPRIAVLTDKGESVVYTVVAGEKPDSEPTAERRIVEVGFTDDEQAQILSGLALDETVVVKGQRSLKNGSPLKILEDESGAGR